MDELNQQKISLNINNVGMNTKNIVDRRIEENNTTCKI